MTKLAISLILSTNLGVKSNHYLLRDNDGLLVNGVKIHSALIPTAAESYGELLPRKIPKPLHRCSAGTFELVRGNVKEKGCLESERGKKVNTAIYYLERLAQYAQITK